MTISVIAVQLYIFAILYLSEREISLTYLKLKFKISKSFSYKNAKTEKIVNKMLTHTKNVEFVGNTGILAEKMI